MFAPSYYGPRYFPPTYYPTGSPPGLLLFISNVDQTAKLKVRSLDYTDRLEQRSSAKFTVVSKGAAPYFLPEIGEEVFIIQDGLIVFGGSIDKSKAREPVLDTGQFVDCDCVSFDQVLDRFHAFKKYVGFTAGAIVRDLIDVFVPESEKITTAGVQDGLSIETIVFAGRRVSDCIRELADLTGFSWYITPGRDLRFFERSTFAAPFSLSVGSDNYLAGSLIPTRSRGKYRNQQLIRGGRETTDERTENFTGDSERRSWDLQFPVESITSITLDTGGGDVAQTVGVRAEDVDADFDFFFRVGSTSISQSSVGTLLVSGDVLKVTYKGFFPLLVLRTDASEILDRAGVEGFSGIYEQITDDKSIEDGDLAEQKGDGLLRRFGEIPTRVPFLTDVDGLVAGMLITITLPDRGDDLDGKQFLIDTISANDLPKPTTGGEARLRYRVTALSGEHLGGWSRFFRKLQEYGHTISRREGEVLLVPNFLQEVIEITEVFSQTDPLVPADDDTLTGWRWGFARWGVSFWGAPDR